ncbi:MAG: terminase [Burkholderiales bacterium]|jgi:hypothetical protein
MGRPTTYTDEIAAKICEQLADGTPLTKVCKPAGMPAWRTVYHWRKAHPEFRLAMDEARDVGYDAIAEGCIDIADRRGGDPQRDRLRVWTRLQLLAKWSPEKYGDRVSHEHSGRNGQPIETRNVHDLPTDVLRAVVARALARRAAGPDAGGGSGGDRAGDPRAGGG